MGYVSRNGWPVRRDAVVFGGISDKALELLGGLHSPSWDALQP